MTRSTVLKNGALVLLAWTLFGVMSSAHFFVREEAGGDGASFREMLTTIVVFYWVWALFTPVAFAAARYARNIGWTGWMILIAIAPILVVAHAVIYLGIAGVFGADASGALSLASLQSHLVRHGTGGIATVAMIYGIYLFVEAHRRAREREVAAAELSARLAQTDLEVLRWQLHPHFLFNALNTVSTLVLRGAAPEAEGAIEQISRYLRSALSQRADAMVSLAQELAVVHQYIDIERLRFGDALQVEQQTSHEALNTRIPSLILQPLVENAIRYGGPNTSRSGPIAITGVLQGARLVLSVIDPGNNGATNTDAGISDERERPEGFGLNYVKQRLRHFYGSDAMLTLRQSSGNTTVTIDLPISRVTTTS